jgi:cell division control protein 7
MAAWNQSSKIDVWSAGVILLSFLTRRYPFFKAGDDVVSLCEIATVVGSDRLEPAALECQRRVQFPCVYTERNLRELAIARNPKILSEEWDDAVYDLLRRMLEPVPSRRPSSAEALNHPFFGTACSPQSAFERRHRIFMALHVPSEFFAAYRDPPRCRLFFRLLT